jgi:hypothetical protein
MNVWMFAGFGTPPAVDGSIAQMQFREWSAKKNAPSYVAGYGPPA